MSVCAVVLEAGGPESDASWKSWALDRAEAQGNEGTGGLHLREVHRGTEDHRVFQVVQLRSLQSSVTTANEFARTNLGCRTWRVEVKLKTTPLELPKGEFGLSM